MNTQAAQGMKKIIHRVDSVSLGPKTLFKRGHLVVGADEVSSLIKSRALAGVRVHLASPADATRIVKVLDAVEPRTKGPGGAGIFPGFLGPKILQGRGQTHVLKGACVLSAGHLPRAQEGIIDMSGPGAELSPFSKLHNLVIEFDPTPGAAWEEVDDAVRVGVLRVAAFVAQVAIDEEPDEIDEVSFDELSLGNKAGSLPRVGAVTNLQTQGRFKDVFVYGASLGDFLPTFIDANELDDGAIVSGQFGHPALKNPTYVYQNHPVVANLRARHGKDLTFAGVVICPEPVEQQAKELISAHAARLCKSLGWNGAVVTKEGGGNADGDMALKMDALEELGITSVGIFAEMSGPEGTGPSVVVAPTVATGMVSAGNYDEQVVLPAMNTALGGGEIALVGKPATDEIKIPTAVLYCALSPMGLAHTACREAA